MSHLIECPECSKHLQVPDELIGKKVQCPECKHTFSAAVTNDREGTSKAGETVDAPKEAAWEKPGISASGSGKKKKRYEDDDDYDRADHDDDDEDRRDRKRRPSRRSNADTKPGKVQAIGVMTLVGGILAILVFLSLGPATCCLWPGVYYSVVMGIFAIMKGSALLGSDARLHKPPVGIAVMQMINIVNADVVNLVLGIIVLVFCNDDEVQEYLST